MTWKTTYGGMIVVTNYLRNPRYHRKSGCLPELFREKVEEVEYCCFHISFKEYQEKFYVIYHSKIEDTHGNVLKYEDTWSCQEVFYL